MAHPQEALLRFRSIYLSSLRLRANTLLCALTFVGNGSTCHIDELGDTLVSTSLQSRHSAYLNHGFLVRYSPPCFLWIVVNGYDGMEVRRVRVGLSAAALFVLYL